MKHFSQILLVYLFSAAFIYSQGNYNVSSIVSAKLIKGLGTEVIGGNLDFGEIVISGTASTYSKTPDEGLRIKINGHPEKSVMLTFNSVEMTNDQWTNETGGEEGALNFTPDIEYTTTESSYSNAIKVNSGNSYMLSNIGGEGYLFLWVGGNFSISEDQPAGNYSGTLQVNISY